MGVATPFHTDKYGQYSIPDEPAKEMLMQKAYFATWKGVYWAIILLKRKNQRKDIASNQHLLL